MRLSLEIGRRALGWGAALGILAVAPGVQAQSTRPGWGATCYAGVGGTGVTFRVWTSNAVSVSVAGTFNGWSMTAHPLGREAGTSGTWSVDVPGVTTNHNYKYVINESLWRSDPRSRRLNTSDNNNSVVVDPGSFDWQDDARRPADTRDLVIYEAHVGTLGGASGTFTSFSDKLDYLRELGVTAVELMPVNEFPSTTSWGYNPAYPFAVETRYGTPDALKELVRQAHRRDLTVLLDVVHNHWDADSSLWQFDGWAPDPAYGGQYFYNAAPYGFTTWGPRPDYRRDEVVGFIADTFRMWYGEYHLDGFRWDAPKHIIYTTNDVFIPEGLAMISNSLDVMAGEYTNLYNIAEDVKEISGFNSSWDLDFVSEIRSVLKKGSDSDRDMPTVARNVAGTAQRVIYTDSHDTAGDLNNGRRLPAAISGTDPAGYYARKRSTLGAVLVMTSPGVPMLLQGQEMIETNQFSDQRPVDWTRTNTWAGIVRLYQDLIRLRRNLDGSTEGLRGEGVSVFHVDNNDKLVAYSRWVPGTTGRATVVVANFANATRAQYPLAFPEEGAWYVHFNSDSTNYCADYGHYGSEEVVAAGSPPAGCVDIAPYSALVLSRVPRTGMRIREAVGRDTPAGNADGRLDPGETLREQIVLWNKSQYAVSNVVSVLSCDHPAVSLLHAESAYPDMPADGTATNAVDYEYRLAADAPCGAWLNFRLATTFNGLTLTNAFVHMVGQYRNLPGVTNRFAAADTPMRIVPARTTNSLLTIDEPGSNIVGDVQVMVRINHSYDRGLTLALQHPDGTEVILINRRGGSGKNLGTGACGAEVPTVFDSAAALSITSGVAPFAGVYRPEGNLAALENKPLNGTWRLRMTDRYSTDSGTNLCWSLRVVYEQRNCECQSFSNRPPVAHDAQWFVPANTRTNFVLAGEDPDGQAVVFQSLEEPMHGVLGDWNTSEGSAVYTPVHGFVGTDRLAFAASDGITSSLPATVWFCVEAPADEDGDGLPDDWEFAYFTNTTVGVPDADPDGDGHSTREEYAANTDPCDGRSVLRLDGRWLGGGRVGLQWDSVGGTRYGLEYGSGYSPARPDGNFVPLTLPLTNEVDPALPGLPGVMKFTDDGSLMPPATNLRLYRLRVLHW